MEIRFPSCSTFFFMVLVISVVVAISIAVLAAPVASVDDAVSTWTCVPLGTVSLAASVQWQQMNCTSTDIPFWGTMGPLVVNLVTANMRDPSLRLVPVIGKPNNGTYLFPLQEIAAQDGRCVRRCVRCSCWP